VELINEVVQQFDLRYGLSGMFELEVARWLSGVRWTASSESRAVAVGCVMEGNAQMLNDLQPLTNSSINIV
jgi:hypothetical protein